MPSSWGAGVIGSATALELARAGLEVVVVDRLNGPGQGSTSASSAIIRFNYSTFAGIAAAWEAKHCWESWADHLGTADTSGRRASTAQGWRSSTSTWRRAARSCRTSIARAFPTRSGTRPRWPNGCLRSTQDGTGRRNASTTRSSGPIRPTSSAHCGRRTPATSTTPCSPRSILPMQPAELVRSCSSSSRSSASVGPGAGSVALIWRTAPGSTHPSWSTWRARGRRRSTRWPVWATTSRSPLAPCDRRSMSSRHLRASIPTADPARSWPTSISASICAERQATGSTSAAPSPSATSCSGSTTRTTPTTGRPRPLSRPR
ncbi:FAD-dependent oxidoreductase [Aeromicrobium sp. UC242_57]|uniref:FAD-dependent oxidoreductase n=1 Tax=Aeromicrobium sp. UC242_57 TaxID=3374624 RepID=UPI0037BD7620